MANISLVLNLTDPAQRYITQLARELERDLARSGIETLPAEAQSAPGKRGDPVTLGVLTLALITHGAVTALIGCLKTYLSREPTLTIKLAGPDGFNVEVSGRNVDTTELQATLEAAAAVRHK